jgi:peptide/nickel transport system permease protein
MATFLLRRLLQSIPVFVGIVLISFVLLKFSGDPVNVLAAQRASPEERERLREKLGLNKPWYQQMARYFFLDLGNSYRSHRPVRDIVLEGAAVTARLALAAMLVAVLFGLFSGLLSAYKPRTIIDYSSAALSSFGVSIPAFFLAMLLTLIFAVHLKWVPFPEPKPGWEFLIIPIVTLGLLNTAMLARLTRNCMLAELSENYVRTARAKGRGPLRTLLGHAFPNVLVPVSTVIGTDLASLLGGAILTETACSVPGLGRVVFNAIEARDHPVVIGGCLFYAATFVTANLVVDILYGIFDPRIRHQE